MDTEDEIDGRPGIAEVVNDILARHRDGSLSDINARKALAAFITSYAPEHFLDANDVDCLDVYLDISLQLSRRVASPAHPETAERKDVMAGIALGEASALASVRAVAPQ